MDDQRYAADKPPKVPVGGHETGAARVDSFDVPRTLDVPFSYVPLKLNTEVGSVGYIIDLHYEGICARKSFEVVEIVGENVSQPVVRSEETPGGERVASQRLHLEGSRGRQAERR